MWPDSHFNAAATADVRLAQSDVASSLPHVGLAHTADCTDIYSVYAPRARPLIARRLAYALQQAEGDVIDKGSDGLGSSIAPRRLTSAVRIGNRSRSEAVAALLSACGAGGGRANAMLSRSTRKRLSPAFKLPGLPKRAALQLWRSAGGPLPPLWRHRGEGRRDGGQEFGLHYNLRIFTYVLTLHTCSRIYLLHVTSFFPTFQYWCW